MSVYVGQVWEYAEQGHNCYAVCLTVDDDVHESHKCLVLVDNGELFGPVGTLTQLWLLHSYWRLIA